MIHYLHVNGAFTIFFFIGKLGAPLQVVLSWHSSVLLCPMSENLFCACVCVHIEIKIDAVRSCCLFRPHMCAEFIHQKVGLPSRMQVFPLLFFFFCHINIHERTAFPLQETLQGSVCVSSRCISLILEWRMLTYWTCNHLADTQLCTQVMWYFEA